MTTVCYQCSADVLDRLNCCNNGPFDTMTTSDWAGAIGGFLCLLLAVGGGLYLALRTAR